MEVLNEAATLIAKGVKSLKEIEDGVVEVQDVIKLLELALETLTKPKV